MSGFAFYTYFVVDKGSTLALHTPVKKDKANKKA